MSNQVPPEEGMKDATQEQLADEVPIGGNNKRGRKDKDKGSKGSKESKSKKGNVPDGIESQGSQSVPEQNRPRSGSNASLDREKAEAMANVQTPKGAGGSKNADMNVLIQEIKDKKDGLIHDNERDKKDQVILLEQIDRLTYNLEIAEDRSSRRKEVLGQYDKTLKVTQVAYDRLMETAENLQNALEA